ncbi:MAG: DUF3800 domain-containing protein [bacterium]|nr:DUF3800 domain-containing protein [bacterium]
MANIQHYIFVDESGDPGKPFETDADGNKIPTGASLFYILSAIYLDSVKLFALENAIMEIRQKYGFRSEIKSTKLVLFTAKRQKLIGAEVVVDRADRRMYNGDYFSSFDEYLFGRVNTKTIKRIKHITHVNSEYVNAMQLSDLVSGAIKDYFTGKNKNLRKVINRKYLYKIW